MYSTLVSQILICVYKIHGGIKDTCKCEHRFVLVGDQTFVVCFTILSIYHWIIETAFSARFWKQNGT